uniref:Uncharacterized protein n=1 Tax=Mesocestoides corti TaxID=53468 RepID=A0A5K3FPZ7_MESCO
MTTFANANTVVTRPTHAQHRHCVWRRCRQKAASRTSFERGWRGGVDTDNETPDKLPNLIISAFRSLLNTTFILHKTICGVKPSHHQPPQQCAK